MAQPKSLDDDATEPDQPGRHVLIGMFHEVDRTAQRGWGHACRTAALWWAFWVPMLLFVGMASGSIDVSATWDQLAPAVVSLVDNTPGGLPGSTALIIAAALIAWVTQLLKARLLKARRARSRSRRH